MPRARTRAPTTAASRVDLDWQKATTGGEASSETASDTANRVPAIEET